MVCSKSIDAPEPCCCSWSAVTTVTSRTCHTRKSCYNASGRYFPHTIVLDIAKIEIPVIIRCHTECSVHAHSRSSGTLTSVSAATIPGISCNGLPVGESCTNKKNDSKEKLFHKTVGIVMLKHNYNPPS